MCKNQEKYMAIKAVNSIKGEDYTSALRAIVSNRETVTREWTIAYDWCTTVVGYALGANCVEKMIRQVTRQKAILSISFLC